MANGPNELNVDNILYFHTTAYSLYYDCSVVKPAGGYSTYVLSYSIVLTIKG
jgi:hypothetical protein